ncbi:MAG TPA: zinc-binding dehydrogenase, partial [Stenotrophomonas sp.]
VLPLLNVGARIPLCGFISHYNEAESAHGPDRTPQLLAAVLQKRVRLQGFIILDHYATRHADFLRDMSAWIEAGDIVPTEDVVQGLEQAPAALAGLLQGRNQGKVVVQVE